MNKTTSLKSESKAASKPAEVVAKAKKVSACASEKKSASKK